MVGLIDPPVCPLTPCFQSEGDVIILIGETLEEMGGSAYLKEIYFEQNYLPLFLQKIQTLLQEWILFYLVLYQKVLSLYFYQALKLYQPKAPLKKQKYH